MGNRFISAKEVARMVVRFVFANSRCRRGYGGIIWVAPSMFVTFKDGLPILSAITYDDKGREVIDEAHVRFLGGRAFRDAVDVARGKKSVAELVAAGRAEVC